MRKLGTHVIVVHTITSHRIYIFQMRHIANSNELKRDWNILDFFNIYTRNPSIKMARCTGKKEKNPLILE